MNRKKTYIDPDKEVVISKKEYEGLLKEKKELELDVKEYVRMTDAFIEENNELETKNQSLRKVVELLQMVIGDEQ